MRREYPRTVLFNLQMQSVARGREGWEVESMVQLVFPLVETVAFEHL